jgi:FHS family glucose/mannose:H+ symporter-like MFS transporter
MRIVPTLLLTYFVLTLLIGSVGVVILQVQQSFAVSATQAAFLEPSKDISAALASFFLASRLVVFGLKRTLLIGVAVLALACFALPSVPAYLTSLLMFALTGVIFAVCKIAMFAIIGLVTHDPKQHASTMGLFEAFFMFAVLFMYYTFGFFVDDSDPSGLSWMRSYYLMGCLLLLAFLAIWRMPLDESLLSSAEPSAAGLKDMLALLSTVYVACFVIGIFFYVFTEQGLMSWLPSFNRQVLHMPTTLALQMASVLALLLALGRLGSAWLLRFIDWYPLAVVCISVITILLVVGIRAVPDIPGNITSWTQVPMGVWAIPLTGLFFAPLYPMMCSVILSSLPVNKHAPMTGLIMVFSVLGGTSGSFSVGRLFDAIGGNYAYWILPLSSLLMLFAFSALKKQLN